MAGKCGQESSDMPTRCLPPLTASSPSPEHFCDFKFNSNLPSSRMKPSPGELGHFVWTSDPGYLKLPSPS